jgi:hypothetical protein
MDLKPVRSTLHESYETFIRLLGANGANPTNQIAPGVTVTRTGEGAYRITWAKVPGTYRGVKGFSFEAATPADLAGYTVVFDTFDATNKRLDFVVYDSTFAAADIIADQYLCITVGFANTGLTF